MQQVFAEGFLEGKLQGKLQGELEGKLQIAKALKETGIATDIIIKTTGLSESEINKL